MRKPVTFLSQYIYGRWLTYHMQKDGGDYFEKTMTTCNGKPILDTAALNARIQEMLGSDKPFMICRFGATELATMKAFDFELENRYAAQMERIHTLSGVFPETEEVGKKFKDLMLSCIPEADLIGIWPQAFEAYYLRTYGKKDLQYTWLNCLEPWRSETNPWTAALAGKKVLVVHPFKESILSQYAKHETIFPGTDILPAFDLEVLQSVQTSGGGTDERFQSWFEAYEWMKEEVLKREFDVAILGCGAYGFPLAADIRKSGRQAIHMGGITQILFGITGGRWDNDEIVQKYVNENWVRPKLSERPKDSGSVEQNCYW